MPPLIADPTAQRIELAGPWAGFGFQGGHLWTPENGDFAPGDFAWPSLQRNIVREWQRMMALERAERAALRGRGDTAHLAEILAGAYAALRAAGS